MLLYIFKTLKCKIFSFFLYVQKFTIAQPVSHTDQTGAAANTLNTGSSVGDCAIDTFVVTSGGGGNSSPVICGINSNQHSEYYEISFYQ